MIKDARTEILHSISTHLAASAPHNKPASPVNPENHAILSKVDLVDQLKQNLESVNAHCIITHDDAGIAQCLTQIISTLGAQRIAISDIPRVKDLMYLTDLEIEEMEVAPNTQDVFRFDAGVTTAQAAIAETGTLILDSAQERHRLVSLVPPIHIAIIDASKIFQTLNEALTFLRADNDVSPAVTFITGPSRTADIELTLAIGVHGPQHLYVIVNQ